MDIDEDKTIGGYNNTGTMEQRANPFLEWSLYPCLLGMPIDRTFFELDPVPCHHPLIVIIILTIPP